ncbi:MAG TPA: hypothetical protein VFA86_03165 [Gammaproteobacteria bacterium]|nr:hypothetical protein [Gammaproteobacteria bacterium]
MDIYFIDRPLTGDELSELGRLLAGSFAWFHDRAICQRRVPAVLPAPGPHGRYALALPRYIRLFHKHFQRAGAAQSRDQSLALLLPLASDPMAGTLAIALREVAGRLPHIILRRPGEPPRLEIVDPSRLLNWVARGWAEYNPPRSSGRDTG